MPFDAEDFDQIKLRLLRASEVLGNPEVEAEVRRIAEELRSTARDMAPLDFGDLRDAIQVRRQGAQGAGGRFVKGASTYDVFINNNHPVKDPSKSNVTRVGEYAWYVHEHMGWASNPMPFMPSKLSMYAGIVRGVETGGRFLDRAAQKVGPTIAARIGRVIAKEL